MNERLTDRRPKGGQHDVHLLFGDVRLCQAAPLRLLVIRIGGAAHALHPLVLEVRILRPIRKDEQQAHFVVAVIEIRNPK